ncbi:YaiO family outer membrane beta-barrel protein [Pontibacter burrus]|uniref:YaiO family outer membrane beta-barrel protein n=1 Tax=Pontibacter burrus TaxID=2704466 RepID=A0A6B3LYC2_9BACT|nr:YaiO family outer membrane beta-barrel protein [Pontibacter burrus]NEM98424.1 YaiO family outer membrane beta-barrel protein [Pontibacter burrus]
MSASLTLFTGSFTSKAIKITLTLLAFAAWFSTYSFGQSTPEADFLRAREIAFKEKNYRQAIQLCKQVLQQDPQYIDARILLGRLHYWNGAADSAIAELNKAYGQMPAYEDAAQALADVLYFEKQYDEALQYLSAGLTQHPQSRGLMTRKATVLAAKANYKQAYSVADSLLAGDPNNDQLLALTSQLREYSYENRLELTYDYTYFDEQFADAWHLAGISYGRQTKIGPVTGRVNYANRFATKGWQFEADAYPRLSRTFYTYTSFAYSADLPVFPKVRAGLSLYANLPKAWEVEAGARFLRFDESLWSYTFSVSKYIQNFWINGRTFLTQGNNSVANAYSLTTRYYLKGADNYASLIVGWGVSPDDRSQAVRLNSNEKLQSFRIGGGYRFAVAKRHIFSLNSTYENVEYQPETKGNQLNISTLYQFRF